MIFIYFKIMIKISISPYDQTFLILISEAPTGKLAVSIRNTQHSFQNSKINEARPDSAKLSPTKNIPREKYL